MSRCCGLGQIAWAHSSLHGVCELVLASLAGIDLRLSSAMSEGDSLPRLLNRVRRVAEYRLHSEPDALKKFDDWIARARRANERRNRALHTSRLYDPESEQLQHSRTDARGDSRVTVLAAPELNDILGELLSAYQDGLRILASARREHPDLFDRAEARSDR